MVCGCYEGFGGVRWVRGGLGWLGGGYEGGYGGWVWGLGEVRILGGLGGLGFRSIFWLLRSLNCYYPQLAALAGGNNRLENIRGFREV